MNPTPDGASADLQRTIADLQRQLAEARAERDESKAQKVALAGDPCPRRRGHRVRPVIAATALAVGLCTAVAALAQDTTRLPLVTVLQIKTTANIDQTVATMLRDE